ncbi:cupin domain-containing protein [Nakamurella alba]|uniref:cupin domain-containing protein n=1 Tax=Nakamurella alba TaxID=2665158 RepID=UPI0018ABEB05|nr:cupin domain-containing protein [Nakamurella alba]
MNAAEPPLVPATDFSVSVDLSTAGGEALATALGLEPLDPEGGRFRRVYTGGSSTAIEFMVLAPDFSAMHRMRTSDELFFHHAGAPLRMLLLDVPGGREVVLGTDIGSGQVPMVVVPAGIWQGSSPDGPWSLVSTVVSPGFEWSDFEMADTDGLIAEHPTAAARIRELTHRTDPLH